MWYNVYYVVFHNCLSEIFVVAKTNLSKLPLCWSDRSLLKSFAAEYSLFVKKYWGIGNIFELWVMSWKLGQIKGLNDCKNGLILNFVVILCIFKTDHSPILRLFLLFLNFNFDFQKMFRTRNGKIVVEKFNFN